MPNVDYPGAIPMFVDQNRVFVDQNNHTFLVIHKTASAGTAQDIARFFAADRAMASTHYVVGQDGTIVQCVREQDGAAGNCCENGAFASFLPVVPNLNTWSISIEHVDPDPRNRTPLTPAQKSASFALVAHICQRHAIPMRRAQDDGRGGIIGHCDIDPVDRADCPGNYPWEELFAFLQQGDDMIDIHSPDVGNFFVESDVNHWTCRQTGKVLAFGVLAFYKRENGLARLGLPVSNEIAIDAHGATRQHFERGVLFYDPRHVFDRPPGAGDVYYAHLYRGPGQDPRIAELQSQVARTAQSGTALTALKQIIPIVEPFK